MTLSIKSIYTAIRISESSFYTEKMDNLLTLFCICRNLETKTLISDHIKHLRTNNPSEHESSVGYIHTFCHQLHKKSGRTLPSGQEGVISYEDFYRFHNIPQTSNLLKYYKDNLQLLDELDGLSFFLPIDYALLLRICAKRTARERERVYTSIIRDEKRLKKAPLKVLVEALGLIDEKYCIKSVSLIARLKEITPLDILNVTESEQVRTSALEIIGATP